VGTALADFDTMARPLLAAVYRMIAFAFELEESNAV
jgi:hypothetical protein